MNTPKEKKNELLKDRRVVDEIRRHLWIESEKAGYDIGFDEATQDWLENFSKAWMSYHMPSKKPSIKKVKSSSSKKTSSRSRSRKKTSE